MLRLLFGAAVALPHGTVACGVAASGFGASTDGARAPAAKTGGGRSLTSGAVSGVAACQTPLRRRSGTAFGFELAARSVYDFVSFVNDSFTAATSPRLPRTYSTPATFAPTKV